MLFAKIKFSRKFPNLQYIHVVYLYLSYYISKYGNLIFISPFFVASVKSPHIYNLCVVSVTVQKGHLEFTMGSKDKTFILLGSQAAMSFNSLMPYEMFVPIYLAAWTVYYSLHWFGGHY